MAFRAVLDACVLYPFSLRDTLLRLASEELYDPIWTDRILEEKTRNLVKNQKMNSVQANRLEGFMRDAFESAEVDMKVVEQLEPAMTNHVKDRHVLAAAVLAHAEAVITSNLKDFPARACAPLGIEAIHPDDFLLTLYDKRPQVVHSTLRQQAADLKKPPWSLDELLGALDKSVPNFIAAVRGAIWLATVPNRFVNGVKAMMVQPDLMCRR